jgi:exopolysaccharide biosynthesis protein
MVLDSLGRTRVKSTDRLASRMALGVDNEGNFVAVMALGAMTLSDLATLMDNLGLVSALGLDGGLEAQMAFNRPEGAEIFTGQYAYNFLGNFRIDDYLPTLPSVIAFERLELAQPQ